MPELDLTNDQEKKFLRKRQTTSYSIIEPEPAEHLVSWMEEQGYKVGFHRDGWRCGINEFGRYFLIFPNDEIKSAFLIRWS